MFAWLNREHFPEFFLLVSKLNQTPVAYKDNRPFTDSAKSLAVHAAHTDQIMIRVESPDDYVLLRMTFEGKEGAWFSMSQHGSQPRASGSAAEILRRIRSRSYGSGGGGDMGSAG